MRMPGLHHERDLPIVFGGPSLSLASTAQLERFDVRPPVKRGDLAALRGERPRVALLVDGLFGASMAVTPLECQQLLTAGWTLLGSSSIGALRAAELWSAGMIGVGHIYQLLRLGCIGADADLAVAYEPATWKEVSVSVVQVRALVGRLLAEPDGADLDGGSLVAAARESYWMERTWETVLRRWRANGVPQGVLDRARALLPDDHLHPKKIDALEALGLLRADVWISSYNRSL